MNETTVKNLKEAFAGESQAHMRYKIFAKKAREEGLGNIARLFEAVSFAEQVHATNHFTVLDGIAGTSANLQEAVNGENYEVNEMYPSFLGVAKSDKAKEAIQTMHWALEAEKIHAQMYQSAKQSADAKKDIVLGALQICSQCGYTTEGEAPDKCPVCGAVKEAFREF